MIKSGLKFTLAAIALLASVSCSSRWREADSDIDDTVVMTSLAELGDTGAAGAGGLADVLALKDQGSSIYYAEAPGSLGYVGNVLSLVDFTFLGAPQGTIANQISNARIFFFDLPTTSSREVGLIVGVKMGSDTFSYSVWKGTAASNNGKYEATLQGSSSNIVLRSYDIDQDDLTSVIQLRVYVIEADGQESYIGKFSTLIGFGG